MANNDNASPSSTASDGQSRQSGAKSDNTNREHVALQRATNDVIKTDGSLKALPDPIEAHYKALCGRNASWPPKPSKNPEEWEMQGVVADAVRQANDICMEKFAKENIPEGSYRSALFAQSSALCAATAVNSYFKEKDPASPPSSETLEARKALLVTFQSNALELLKKGADLQLGGQKELKEKNPILAAHGEIDNAYNKWNKPRKVKDHFSDILPEPFSLIGSFVYELFATIVKGTVGIGVGVLKAIGETHALLQSAGHKKSVESALEQIANEYKGEKSTQFLKNMLEKGAASVTAAKEEKGRSKQSQQGQSQSPAGQGVAASVSYPQMQQTQQNHSEQQQGESRNQRTEREAAASYPEMRQPQPEQTLQPQNHQKPPKPKKGAANTPKSNAQRGAGHQGEVFMSGGNRNAESFNARGALNRMGVTAEHVNPGTQVRPTGDRGNSGRSAKAER